MTNKDVLATFFNAEEFGVQTSGFKMGIGSEPNTSKYYRLAFIGEDREGRVYKIVANRTQMSVSGNLFGKSEAGYYMLPFQAEVLSDSFFPEGADLVTIERID